MHAGLITAHFAASVLMIDFPNPVFSPYRAKLLEYAPVTAILDPAGGGLSQQIADAIAAAAAGLPADSLMRSSWPTGNLPPPIGRRSSPREFSCTWQQLVTDSGTSEGFDDYVRLAQFRLARIQSHAAQRIHPYSARHEHSAWYSNRRCRCNVDGTVSPKEQWQQRERRLR